MFRAVSFHLTTCYIVCSRCCCTCAKSLPAPLSFEAQQDPEAVDTWKARVKSRRTALIVMFLVFVTFAFITIHIFYVGNAKINEGVNGAIDVINFLKNLFTTVAKAADAINADIKTALSNVDLAAKNFDSDPSCNGFGVSLESLSKNSNSAITNSLSISNLIKPVTDALANVVTLIQQYAITDKNLVVYIFYAIILAVVIVYYLLFYLRIKIGLQVSLVHTYPLSCTLHSPSVIAARVLQ